MELFYEATCIDLSGNTTELRVGGQPRCYSKICGDDAEEDDQDLFERFTLRPTEARNGETCTGVLTELQSGSNFESEIANESEVGVGVVRKEADAVTTVVNKRSFWTHGCVGQLRCKLPTRRS